MGPQIHFYQDTQEYVWNIMEKSEKKKFVISGVYIDGKGLTFESNLDSFLLQAVYFSLPWHIRKESTDKYKRNVRNSFHTAPTCIPFTRFSRIILKYHKAFSSSEIHWLLFRASFLRSYHIEWRDVIITTPLVDEKNQVNHSKKLKILIFTFFRILLFQVSIFWIS